VYGFPFPLKSFCAASLPDFVSTMGESVVRFFVEGLTLSMNSFDYDGDQRKEFLLSLFFSPPAAIWGQFLNTPAAKEAKAQVTKTVETLKASTPGSSNPLVLDMKGELQQKISDENKTLTTAKAWVDRHFRRSGAKKLADRLNEMSRDPSEDDEEYTCEEATPEAEPENATLKVTFKGQTQIGMGGTKQWSGDLIRKIVPDGQAAKAGVQVGMTVLSVKGEPFTKEKLEGAITGEDYQVVFGKTAVNVVFHPGFVGVGLSGGGACNTDAVCGKVDYVQEKNESENVNQGFQQGVRVGMIVVSINGEPYCGEADYNRWVTAINSSTNYPVVFAKAEETLAPTADAAPTAPTANAIECSRCLGADAVCILKLPDATGADDACKKYGEALCADDYCVCKKDYCSQQGRCVTASEYSAPTLEKKKEIDIQEALELAHKANRFIKRAAQNALDKSKQAKDEVQRLAQEAFEMISAKRQEIRSDELANLAVVDKMSETSDNLGYVVDKVSNVMQMHVKYSMSLEDGEKDDLISNFRLLSGQTTEDEPDGVQCVSEEDRPVPTKLVYMVDRMRCQYGQIMEILAAALDPALFVHLIIDRLLHNVILPLARKVSEGIMSLPNPLTLLKRAFSWLMRHMIDKIKNLIPHMSLSAFGR